MKKFSLKLITLLCTVFTLTSQAQTQSQAQAQIELKAQPGVETVKPAEHPVGLRMLGYTDSSRTDWNGTKARPLNGTIWYPAQNGSEQKDLEISVLKLGKFAVGAPLSASQEKFPLVLISHGTGGSTATLAWLARSLAAQGYIVAGVNHHGNTAAEPEKRAEGFIAWWERPRDISVLIDHLLADPVFGAHIDAQKIAVAGFSLGAYSALATVGARLDFRQWQTLCETEHPNPQCSLPPEAPFTRQQALSLLTQAGPFQQVLARSDASYLEQRIRAAFVIAPVGVAYMVPASLHDITVPLELVVGELDDQSVPEKNVKALAAQIKAARFSVLPNVAHYTFLSECTNTGKQNLPQLCLDNTGVNRAEIHQKIGRQAVEFFNRSLF